MLLYVDCMLSTNQSTQSDSNVYNVYRLNVVDKSDFSE